MRLVEGDVLDADGGIVAVDVDDAVDQQERVAMRQKPVDAVNVEAVIGVSASSAIGASFFPAADIGGEFAHERD